MEICQFLNESYTSYHTTENVCKILRENGFTQLVLGEKWNIKVGGSYFTTHNGSSVIAFKVGSQKAFNICESHTDSPAFNVKGGSVIVGKINRLNTEKYGGGILYSFFDRPLKVAGRLLCQIDGGVEQVLVASSYNVVIPSLAIHHNPNVNEGIALNAQNDTLPLFSCSATDLYKTLTDKTVLDADLFVVPATQAFNAGANGEFLCSARLDNLSSVFSSVQALVQSTPQNIAVVACLDNEEIGSGTRQGSPDLIATVLEQIEDSLQFSSTEKIAARENGFVLSVDNGHATHPAHPEKSDPVKNVTVNGGVVIKHHPNYATDGLTSALFKKLLEKQQLPYQDYYNRSDVRCGSTLGLVTSRRLGIKTCDIGLAQLAMHSACETLGVRDLDYLNKAITLFFEASFCEKGNRVEIK